MKIPKDVNYILDKLNDNGYEGFIVGGCVRDSIMRATPKDWDITTSATPQEVKNIFKHTYDTGIKHGTITVVIGKNNYEVTTYRIDGEYLDNRRPSKVTFTKNLEEDLMRRDFTINAIAFHEKLGFIDPFFGTSDIKDKKIRAVLEPSKRFQEDALRMLRAVRFSAQLNFDIEPKTMQSIKENSYLIKNISIERIRDEITKLIMSDLPIKFHLLNDCNLMEHILENNKHSFEIINNKISEITDCLLISEKDLEVRLALVLQFLIKEETIKFLKYFKYDNKTIKNISFIVEGLNKNIKNDFYEFRKEMNEVSPFIFEKILKVKTIILKARKCNYDFNELQKSYSIFKSIIENRDCISLGDLKINGNQLKELGITNGEEIGKTLKFLLDEVMKYPENNDFEILKILVEKEK